MSQAQPNLDLQYQIKPDIQLTNGVLIISGEVMDESVNQRNWQVPTEEQDYLIANSQDALLIVDHGDKDNNIRTEHVHGKITSLVKNQIGGRDTIQFTAEASGDPEFLNKLQSQYIQCVSPRVIGSRLCSGCGLPTFTASGEFLHLCKGAHEVIRRPKMVELSIVPLGAYKNSKFKVLGFKAAFSENQNSLVASALLASQRKPCGACALAPTIGCLACSNCHSEKTELHKETQNKMSTLQTPPTMEEIKAAIAEAVKPVMEACTRAEAAASKAVEASSPEKFTAITNKVRDELAASMKLGAKAANGGKGAQGALGGEDPKKPFNPGAVTVTPYFKDLLAAASKQQALFGAAQNTGVA